ncbi:hypothetical protein N177_1084 [Lutibaculum baratangense AMV1]|uniref:Uncharacterized protein n=1 Tax=Lutibaculum baratangense AMV1 TaxID=631454 RepID=V4RSW5_9HYPH|nr:hypothetical protein N177_1084 [Lutibaculum baratangense AMV1]
MLAPTPPPGGRRRVGPARAAEAPPRASFCRPRASSDGLWPPAKEKPRTCRGFRVRCGPRRKRPIEAGPSPA